MYAATISSYSYIAIYYNNYVAIRMLHEHSSKCTEMHHVYMQVHLPHICLNTIKLQETLNIYNS